MSDEYYVHAFVRVTVAESSHRNVRESVARQLSLASRSRVSEPAAELVVRPYSDLCRSAKARIGDGGIMVEEGVAVSMRHQIAARFEESRITFFLGVRGVNINPYLQLLLAPQGVSMVHAAGVERNGDVLLLPAFGGAGKTLAAGVLVQEH